MSEPITFLGFSGGGDSTYLLRKLRAEGRRVFAGIVDHGLREGSAADARRAADIAREAGADVEIVTLSWPNGAKAAQAAARRGRMAALATLARRAGAKTIALAHTLDDQAETVLIRLAAGSSWRGLAGMSVHAPAPLWPEGRGLTMYRPLLRERRGVLRSALQQDGATWLEDPANTLSRYARVRARARLAAWAPDGLGPERWAALADRFSPHAAALDEGARACVAAAATFEEGRIVLSPETFAAFEEEVRLRALGAVLAAAGGAEREAPELSLRRLLGQFSGTLGGAKLRANRGKVEITRDPGGLLGRGGQPGLPALPLPGGQEVFWDGRLALRIEEAGWAAEPDPAAAAPRLRRGNACLTLMEARAAGLIDAQWLLEERIAHLLWRK